MMSPMLWPIVIPFIAALAALAGYRSLRWQRLMLIVGTGAALTMSIQLLLSVIDIGPLAVQLGDWRAPFGITLVADRLSAIMVVLTHLMGLAVGIYSLGGIDNDRLRFFYVPIYLVLLMGVSGAFLTGDLFNLYVWFEVMLIASFVLLALGGTKAQLEGAVKYVAINLLSSIFFLAGIGILYGKAGTLNMADLAVIIAANPDAIVTTSTAMLFLVAFGVKAALFPLFFWLPASYHTPPPAISALFAGLLTKVGVYALIRVFSLIFVSAIPFTHTVILIISGVTMVVGVLGAAVQTDMRKILSWHIISQIGYMTMGLGLFSPLALAGSIFYLMHHIVVKTNLFLVAGVVRQRTGTEDLAQLGGYYKSLPWLAILFMIPAMSLGGIPPLSGFFAKLALVQAGLDLTSWAIVATALAVSLMTIFSMIKIWGEVFWKASPATDRTDRRTPVSMILPIVGLAVVTIIIGLYAEPFAALASEAANDLIDPSAYIAAVLAGGN